MIRAITNWLWMSKRAAVDRPRDEHRIAELRSKSLDVLVEIMTDPAQSAQFRVRAAEVVLASLPSHSQ